MVHDHINRLLDKYWLCATSVEEERELRIFFSNGNVPVELLPYKSWFVSSEAESIPPLGDTFDNRILARIAYEKKMRRKRYYRIALLLLLLLLLTVATFFCLYLYGRCLI